MVSCGSSLRDWFDDAGPLGATIVYQNARFGVPLSDRKRAASGLLRADPVLRSAAHAAEELPVCAYAPAIQYLVGLSHI